MTAVVSSLMPEWLVARDVKARSVGMVQPQPQRYSTGTDVMAPPSTHAQPSDRTERIRRRAYERYEARGAADGHDLADWLEAERQIDSGR